MTYNVFSGTLNPTHLPTVAEIWQYFDFSRWRPSAILDLLCVFGLPTNGIWWSIAVRNLVGIDAVVLIICMFFDFTSLA